jgi:hypothetical protein
MFAAVVALALAVSVTFAQKKPDFTGTWVTISPADAAGQEETFRQDANMLTNSHPSEGGGHSFTYRFDGVETRSVIGNDVVTLSKAGWEGERLVATSTTTYGDGRKLEQRKVFSLDDKGQLVINLTQTMTGQPANTVTVVYRKK